MQYALSLAAKGWGKTGINPLVGAVIVKNRRIIGQGFHRRIGEAHAEIVALAQAGTQAQDADLYVNLEPCCTQGHTPPCVNTIIARGIRRVVVGATDPNPAVNCRGILMLRRHNIEVVENVLKIQATALNRWYQKYIVTRMPYVIVKIALTQDMRASGFATKYITSEPSLRYVHALRSQVGAVLVGINTVCADNPFLTDRLVGRHNPARIVVDPHLRIALNTNFLSPNARRIIITKRDNDQEKIRALEQLGVEMLFLEGDHYSTSDLLRSIGTLKISSVLVEGGAEIFADFLKDYYDDELYVFIAPSTAPKGIAIQLDPEIFEKNAPERIGEDLLYHVYRNN
jgi:diaminohydroxyphosphoribosylaminopyrimidine deaminase/5-amino-6-(5-phosphoribosylamino)uracil reductase